MAGESKKNTATVDLDDIQEIISMLGKLNENQKQIILASMRGAVLIADSEQKGGHNCDIAGNKGENAGNNFSS